MMLFSYIRIYKEYMKCKGDKKKKDEAAKLKEELEEKYDKKYPFVKIVPLRTIAQKEIEFDELYDS